MWFCFAIPLLSPVALALPKAEYESLAILTGFNRPQGIAVAASGEIYVANADGRIDQFDKSHRLVRSFGLGTLSSTGGLALDGHRRLYAVDPSRARVEIFSLEGVHVGGFGSVGSGPGELDGPSFIAVGHQGLVYVVEGGPRRVQVFDSEGRHVREWSVRVPDVAHFATHSPSGIGIAPSGDIFVANVDGYVQRFSPDGEFVRKWRAPDGPLSTFGLSGLACDQTGNVYAAQYPHHRVLKYSADGMLLTSFGEMGTGPGQMRTPAGVAVGRDGTVYVTELGNQRVQVFGRSNR